MYPAASAVDSYTEFDSSEFDRASQSARVGSHRNFWQKAALEGGADASGVVSSRASANLLNGSDASRASETVDFSARNLRAATAFVAEQEWEGEVVELCDDAFIARLHDLTCEQPRDIFEEAEFSIRDISDYEIPLLKEGAIFRWSLGYYRTSTGGRSRGARLVFRRLPAWTPREIAQSQQEARKLMESIEWDDD